MAFDPRQLTQLAAEHGTPLWVYDAAVIRERIAQLRRFDVIRYAQKACSNLHILRLMRAEGVMVDEMCIRDSPDSGADRLDPPARQAARRHRRQADGGAHGRARGAIGRLAGLHRHG